MLILKKSFKWVLCLVTHVNNTAIQSYRNFKSANYHSFVYLTSSLDAPTSNCNDGNIRVIDTTDDSGRVQICENGIYNSICSEQWTDSNAEVVCRELGLVPQGNSDCYFLLKTIHVFIILLISQLKVQLV